MKFLINPMGTHGDVLPVIALGCALQKRGHDVCIYAHRRFESHIREVGLAVRVLDCIGYDEELLRNPDVLHYRKIVKHMARITHANTEAAYQAMKADIRGKSRDIATIGTSFAFAGRLLRETDNIPLVTLHLSTSLLRSNIQPPRLSPSQQVPPSFIAPAVWRFADRWLLDPLFAPALNEFRARIGLAPIKRVLNDWLHDSDVLIGMMPEWFAERPRDWPDKLQLTGFPLYDHGGDKPLPPDVQAFLDAGDAPIGFVPGTFTATAREFFEVSIEACRRLQRRGILLSPFADHVPRSLPPDVVHFGYVPFAALLPKLAALVHHGGIGTMSQALRAGVPQLARPVVGDQFENCKWLARLGVSRELPVRSYTAKAASKALAELIDDPSVQHVCKSVSHRMQANDGIGRTLDAILASLAPAEPANYELSVGNLNKRSHR